MKNRTVIIVLLTAALLLGFIFFFERDTMTTSERKERADRVFKAFKRDAVDAMTIRGTDGGEVSLERVKDTEAIGEEQWNIIAPTPLDADSAEVRSVLSAIDYLIVGRTVRGKEHRNDARYGLTSPRVTASFSIRGRTVSFGLGAQAADKSVYLAIDGEEDAFYAVEKEFLEAMDKSLSDLRSKKLVTSDLENATQVSVSSKQGATYSLQRTSGGPWQLDVQGTPILAAEDQVQALVQAVKDIKAASFVADGATGKALDEHGLPEETTAVIVHLDDGKTLSIRVGGPCEGADHQVRVAVAEHGIIICAEDDFIPILDRPVARLREMRPAVFLDGDVSSIALSVPDQALTMEKVEGVWQVPGEDGPELEQSAVTDLLGALRETTATDILPGKEALAGLKEPIATAILTLVEPDRPIELRFYKGKTRDMVRVQRGDEAALLIVPVGLYDQVRPNALAFRKRKIEIGEAEDVEKIAIKGGVSQILEKADGIWRLTDPVALEADGMAARALAEQLAEIQVDAFVAPRANSTHGFDQPHATVTARLIKEEPTREEQTEKIKDRTQSTDVILEIGGATGDNQRFARLKGEDPTVFTVGAKYIDAIAAPMVARDFIDIDDTDIINISLTAGEQSISLKQTGEAWSAENNAPFDETAFKRLLADLGGMKAIRSAAFGVDEAAFATETLVIKTWSKDHPDKDKPTTVIVGPRTENEKEDGYVARLADVAVTVVLPARIIDEAVSFIRKSAPQDAGL
ncbi:MAG: DUF4340 domain-containing protein [Myxococcota bacterium]|nr:DUF4340 domain-containing protein [Myxococcota bacterium]